MNIWSQSLFIFDGLCSRLNFSTIVLSSKPTLKILKSFDGDVASFCKYYLFWAIKQTVYVHSYNNEFELYIHIVYDE